MHFVLHENYITVGAPQLISIYINVIESGVILREQEYVHKNEPITNLKKKQWLENYDLTNFHLDIETGFYNFE